MGKIKYSRTKIQVLISGVLRLKEKYLSALGSCKVLLTITDLMEGSSAGRNIISEHIILINHPQGLMLCRLEPPSVIPQSLHQVRCHKMNELVL